MYKVNLYYNRRIIDLTLAVVGVPHWNLNMNDFTFRLYKGSRNSIEVMIRNNDRKPIDLVGKSVIFTITNKDTYELLWQNPIVIANNYAGSAVLVLEPYEIDSWPLGYLRYTVMMQHEDSSQSMLYVDHDEGSSGYLELLEGPNLGPVDSISCSAFLPVLNNNDYFTYYYSTSFPGNAQLDRHDYNLMTMAIYTTNWTGKIYVQGCLEDATPTVDGSWFSIPILGSDFVQLINYSSITPLSFEASLRWVRVMYLPDAINTGTFDKILYRN